MGGPNSRVRPHIFRLGVFVYLFLERPFERTMAYRRQRPTPPDGIGLLDTIPRARSGG